MINTRPDLAHIPNPESLSFPRRRSLWLDQVHADPELSPFTFKLAYALARFFNEQKGYAWPSMGRLATECRVTRNGVKNAINNLVVRGHLHREIRPGRNRTNHFRWVTHVSAALNNDPEAAMGPVVAQAINGRSPLPNTDMNTATAVAIIHEETATAVAEKGNDYCEKGQPPLHKTVTAVAPTNIKNLIKKQAKTLSNHARVNSDSISFEQFWEVYPKKVSRPDALIAFSRALGRTPLETIIAGASRYSEERNGKDPQYTKSPARWLESEGWLDLCLGKPLSQNSNSPISAELDSGSMQLNAALNRALAQLGKRVRSEGA